MIYLGGVHILCTYRNKIQNLCGIISPKDCVETLNYFDHYPFNYFRSEQRRLQQVEKLNDYCYGQPKKLNKLSVGAAWLR